MYARISLLALTVAASLAAAVAVALPEREAALRGVDFIRTAQQSDGGFGGFGPGQTMDAIYAIRSVGIDPNSVRKDGNSPCDYLRANAAGVTRPGLAAKFILGALACNLNPIDVGGTNLVAVVTGAYDDTTGRYASDDFNHSLSVIGLAAAGVGVPNGAIQALRDSQLSDGGWGFGGSSDPDSTAIALQALLAANVSASDPDVQEGIALLRATQAADGGWGFDPNASNVNSTAFVVQALIAAGEDPESATYTKSGGNPIQFLLSQQQPDGSFVGYDPAFATNQVIPALMGRSYLLAPLTPILDVTPTPTASPTATPSPSATRTPTPVVARSGNGVASPSGDDWIPALLIGGLLLAAGGALGAQAIGRRRG